MSDPENKLVLFPFISRSGSTFLFDRLGRHEKIFVCPEAEVLIHRLLVSPNKPITDKEAAMNMLKTAAVTDTKFADWKIPTTELEDLNYDQTFFDLFTSVLTVYKELTKPDAEIILFKGPPRLLNTIIELGKSTSTLHDLVCATIIRDGRAAFASQKKAIRPATGLPMQVSPIASAQQWASFLVSVSTVNSDQSVVDLYILKYEELLRDPVVHLTPFLRKLGLEPSNSMTDDSDFSPRIPKTHRSLHSNIEKSPMTSRIDAWVEELSMDELFYYEKTAGEQLKKFGYDLLAKQRPPFLKHISFLIKDFCRRLLLKIKTYPVQRRLR